MLKLDIYNKEGKVISNIDLSKEIFDGKVNEKVLYYYINAYNANQRQGNACVKDRSMVAGSSKRPWKQKGTGSARAGSRKSPIWRGGGVTFGPIPRSYRIDLPVKVKKVALLSALRAKLKESKLFIIDEFKIDAPKTKKMILILDKLKLGSNVLIATDKKDEMVLKSASNIKKTEVRECANLNAYDVLLHDKVLITKDAVKLLEKKLQGIKKKVKK